MAAVVPLKLASGQIQQFQTGDLVDPRFLGNRGTTAILFPNFPGASDASITVTGQTGITAFSTVKAWIALSATGDHSADEHFVESIVTFAGNVNPGVGFTLYARNSGFGDTRLYGSWSIGWEWF